jgi:peptidoglycan/xylan/chitin deacetylase (PgdA/CDA1 family)
MQRPEHLAEHSRLHLEDNPEPISKFTLNLLAIRRLVKMSVAALAGRRRLMLRGPRRARSVCLTFDDGPDPIHTPPLLDLLHERQVRATFFVIGACAARYPELVGRLVAEGHVIGNHSYWHRRPHQIAAGALMDEVEQTTEVLAELAGENTRLFRPPFGKLTAWKLARLWGMGQTVVLWNRDPKDFACRSASVLSEWFGRHPLQAGDLVLFHDNYPHAVAVLPELIDDVRRRGLEFATVADWLGPHGERQRQRERSVSVGCAG